MGGGSWSNRINVHIRRAPGELSPCTQKSGHGNSQRSDCCLQAKGRGLRMEPTFQPPEKTEINFFCLSHPVYGILLWEPNTWASIRLHVVPGLLMIIIITLIISSPFSDHLLCAWHCWSPLIHFYSFFLLLWVPVLSCSWWGLGQNR